MLLAVAVPAFGSKILSLSQPESSTCTLALCILLWPKCDNFVVVINPTVKIYYRHRDVVVLRVRNSRGAKHQRHKTHTTKTKGRDNTQVQPPGAPSGVGTARDTSSHGVRVDRRRDALGANAPVTARSTSSHGVSVVIEGVTRY